MMTRTGVCGCGAVRVRTTGEPVRVSVCHCHACQRRTSSAFGAQARFPDGSVSVEGATRGWTRVGDSGGQIDYRFCETCGTTVSWTLSGLPGFTVIPLGLFAGTMMPAPTVSIYEARAHPWAPVTGEVEHLD